ncbi:MAG: hypothetical protein ACI4XP_03245 [Acutalibacteraceae bacterium]
MVKTFDHAVIYNGVLYSANTPIEFAEPKKEENEVSANDKRTGRKPKSRNNDN